MSKRKRPDPAAVQAALSLGMDENLLRIAMSYAPEFYVDMLTDALMGAFREER